MARPDDTANDSTHGGSDDYIIAHKPGETAFDLWRLDLADPQLLRKADIQSDAKLMGGTKLTPLGNFILEWGRSHDFPTSFVYRLWSFDPSRTNPLEPHLKNPFDATTQNPVTQGLWDEKKFFWGRLDFGHYGNKQSHGFITAQMQFVPLGNFLLAWIPKPGRGTNRLWNFDPWSSDPLPVAVTPENAWGWIEHGHELHGLGNYVLDREPETGKWKLWSFDPQSRSTLRLPWLGEGQWEKIGADRTMVAIGDMILDYCPETRAYRLWQTDPDAAMKGGDILGGSPIHTGTLPEGIDAETALTGFQPVRPIHRKPAAEPGTTDYMRSKIKHVVYYMIENRSFDHIMGWLYENDKPARIIGPGGDFDGASLENWNISPPTDRNPDGEKIHTYKYAGGKMGNDVKLEMLPDDPHHDFSDVMRQLFHPDMSAYDRRETPTMGGFVMNNGYDEVMATYSPEQIPVISGLAKHFAISDRWFCSTPGGTDVNRAFSLTGSSLEMLNNFQNGTEYDYWPFSRHRPSIWKVLWANGITDWKIYNSIEWIHHIFSYQLFLRGQIPSVDAAVDKARAAKQTPDFLAGIEQFKKDAREGNLPAFSFLEPVWIANTGTTSYHPGGDLVPGEVALNEVYEALKAGPNWDETLLVLTFDEHGGIHDHVAPPYARNPWPNDEADGFKFDIMGVRVPTILVSPMIDEKTVFRSTGKEEYEATSFLSTLLSWFGVPKARWGLGDRTHHSPTFEGVVDRAAPRTDMPSFTPPHDSEHPIEGDRKATVKYPAHDLQRLMARRIIEGAFGHRLDGAELTRLADEVAERPLTQEDLYHTVARALGEEV